MADAQVPHRLPVVDIIESRDATMAFDSKVVNGLVEQGQTAYRAIKRAGMSAAFQGVIGLGQGITDYNGQLYGVSGDFLNQYQAGSAGLTLVTSNGGFPARDGAAGVGFLGQLWIIGGDNAGTLTNDAWVSVTGAAWAQNTTVPTGVTNRTGAKAIVLNNVLYIMGGQNASGGFLNDVWSTPDGANWTQITPSAAWSGRADFELLVFGGQIYLSGGKGQSSANGDPSNGLWHDVWTTSNGTAWVLQNPACPWIGRRRFGFFMTGAVMNVLGGFVSSGTNQIFANAVTDQWQSSDNGVTWTRISTNAFGVAGCPMLPWTVVTSVGQLAQYGRALTTVPGAGGSGAICQTYASGDDDLSDQEWCEDHVFFTVTFTTVGSGYTTACGFTDPGDGGSIPVTGYGFLDGTAVSGGRGGEVVFANGIYYYLTTYINGAQKDEIWTSTNGTAWTLLTSTPGYATRSMQAFVYGNIWIIGGSTGGVTFYNDVWTITASSGSFALTPTVANEFYYFNQTSLGLTTPLLVFTSPHQGYTFNAALGTLTQITDPDYPPVIVPGIVYLDTTFYVMDPAGKIWGSDLNNPLSWTALNEIAIQNEPNGGVAIAKCGTYLVGYGQWTCEFFYDAGNPVPGSPLSANLSLAYQIGAANGRSVVEMQGTNVFVGQTHAEGAKVYMFQGYAPQIISTPFIDRILQADPLTNVNAYPTSMFGHPCYVLTLRSSGVTLVYDFTSNFWYTWTSSTPTPAVNIAALTVTGVQSSLFTYLTASTAPVQHGLRDGDPVTISGVPMATVNGMYNVSVTSPTAFTFIVPALASNQTSGAMQGIQSGPYNPVTGHEVSPGNFYYLQDPVNGQIYLVNPALGSDVGNVIDFNVVTGRFDGGLMRIKTFTRASVVGDITASTLLIRYTNTDYQSWSFYRPVNMQAQWAFISSLGQASRQAYQLRHTDFTPQRLEALEIEFELGV